MRTMHRDKCPVCGSDGIAELGDDNRSFRVVCVECGLRTEDYKTWPEATDVWNRHEFRKEKHGSNR